jgi:hypothetical protein
MVCLQESLIIGPRGDGKTTNINRVREQLQDQYCCLFVAFRHGITFKNKKDFWEVFGRRIQRDNLHVKVPTLLSSDDFSNFLHISNKEKLFGNKQVVLFLDDFDVLYHENTTENTSVMEDVQNVLNQAKESSCLHSLVGIGSFSFLALPGMSASPFNHQHAVRSPNFDEKDVLELFAQVKEDYGEMMDDRIPMDVFQRTGGHKEWTTYCGKCLLETVWQGREFVRYQDWLSYVFLLFIEEYNGWAPMRKIFDTLEKPIAKRSLSLLLTHFLHSSLDSVTLKERDVPYAQFLVAEGALIHTNEPRTYAIASQLIRNLLVKFLIHEPIKRKGIDRFLSQMNEKNSQK